MAALARCMDVAMPYGDQAGPTALDLEPVDGRDLGARRCVIRCRTDGDRPSDPHR
jgi:hypothetical protein